MALMFRCSSCTIRKFLEEYEILHGSKFCLPCAKKQRMKEQEERYQQHLEKKHGKRQEQRKLADRRLLEEVAEERKKSVKREKKHQPEQEIKPAEKPLERKKMPEEPSFEEMTTHLSYLYDPLLYVHVTVKRLQAIEWRQTKKKILLNKEREIRKTHKGGWSQEKFQHFVKSQKGKAPEWIEENLLKKGVLRPPYAKIVIEGDDGLKEVVRKLLEEFTDGNGGQADRQR